MKQTYIALLRGVNVGGRVVTMERLRALFAEIGLAGARTFIQSGNVFFETSASDRAMLARKIARHLETSLGYAVPVFLRTVDELEAALALDPFAGLNVTEDMGLYLLFLSKPLPNDVALPLRSAKGEIEVLHATAGEAFAVVHRVNGRPGNPVAFLEKAYKIDATSRFFGTVAKIAKAARAAR